MLPLPRSYVDWEVPTSDAGTEVGICTDETDYRRYLEWLASYLFLKDIPILESQQAILSCYRVLGVDHAVIELSDHLGYSILDTESIQQMSASGQPFSEQHVAELETWNYIPDEAKEDWTEEDYFTSESDYIRLGEEFKEEQKVPSHIRHADIPYRPVLAALFKDVPDPKKRYDLLDCFYRNFNECASK